MMTISFGLSEKEIDRAIKQVEKYKKDIENKTKLLAERLAHEGVMIAQAKIMEFPSIYTGELLSSISDEPGMVLSNGAEYIIYTGCEWAPYVEFGTGIVGSENPHPNPAITNWKYDVNQHGEAGWNYFKDGEWHWTKGMPSRPFMYETAQDLRLKIPIIAREVFGNG